MKKKCEGCLGLTMGERMKKRRGQSKSMAAGVKADPSKLYVRDF